MKLTPKIQKAINQASVWHNKQKRKSLNLPFIVHPFTVAYILSNYTDDENIIIAGLLHDVIEDVPKVDYKKIENMFGKKVAKIVKEVSDGKKPNDSRRKNIKNWQERKSRYLEHMKTASHEALMVGCADKIHNLGSLIYAYEEDGKKIFKRFNAPIEKRLWFYSEIIKVLKQNLKNDIVLELEKTYKKALKVFK